VTDVRIAFHFLNSDWTAHGGFHVEVGKPYHVPPPIVPCERGLHASTRAIDALSYATGPVVTLVECSGEIVEHGIPVDKIACSNRVALWGYDATEELRYFARWCALEVIYLWPDAPDVVREYLETGDEEIWDAARAAARDAAWAAARAAARAAAGAAAWAAAWDAAWDVFLEDANHMLESLLLDGAVARGLL
jgi:hypothetical protein